MNLKYKINSLQNNLDRLKSNFQSEIKKMQEQANLEMAKNKMKEEENNSKFNCIFNEKQEKLNELCRNNKNLKEEKENINRKIENNQRLTKVQWEVDGLCFAVLGELVDNEEIKEEEDDDKESKDKEINNKDKKENEINTDNKHNNIDSKIKYLINENKKEDIDFINTFLKSKGLQNEQIKNKKINHSNIDNNPNNTEKNTKFNKDRFKDKKFKRDKLQKNLLLTSLQEVICEKYDLNLAYLFYTNEEGIQYEIKNDLDYSNFLNYATDENLNEIELYIRSDEQMSQQRKLSLRKRSAMRKSGDNFKNIKTNNKEEHEDYEIGIQCDYDYYGDTRNRKGMYDEGYTNKNIGFKERKRIYYIKQKKQMERNQSRRNSSRST